MSDGNVRGSGKGKFGSGGSGRPERTYTTGNVTGILRWLALVGAVVVTVAVVARYPGLPDTVPTHYGASGNADDWGSKSTVLVMTLIVFLLIVGIHWLSYRPRLFNYPKEVTEDNAQQLYRAGEQMMVWVNIGMVLVYAGLAATMLSTADTAGLILPGIVFLLGATAVGLVKTVRA